MSIYLWAVFSGFLRDGALAFSRQYIIPFGIVQQVLYGSRWSMMGISKGVTVTPLMSVLK